MRIQTDIANIDKSPKEVFEFLGNFKNYSKLMPPEISDWNATEKHCTFKKDKFVKSHHGEKLFKRYPCLNK